MGIDSSHKAVIKEHLELSMAEAVPLDQIHRELVEVFSQTDKYSLQQITAVTSWLRSEILRSKRTVEDAPSEESAPTNEDVNFNNPAKNESREWHVANIANHISLEQRRKMRFSLLPGKNDFDIRALQEIGISCRNMLTFMLGEDPKATAEYVRMCRRYGIEDRRIGNMNNILPTIDKPVDGVYWDFFGQICNAYIQNMWSLPLEPNSEPIPIGINIMKGREHKSTKDGLLISAYRAIQNAKDRLMGKQRSWLDQVKILHTNPDPSELEGIDLSQARNSFLESTFLSRVGVANTKNWILPEHAKKVIEIYLQARGIKKMYDELSDIEKFTYLEEGMNVFTLLCREMDSTAEEQRSPMTVPMAFLSAGTSMGLVNRPIIKVVEKPMEYKSAHKNRPFLSLFGVIQTDKRHYEHHTRAMEFFLDVMTHYAPIFLGRKEDDPSTRDGIGIFEVNGSGPKKQVIYRDTSGKRITSILHDSLIEACVELSVSKAITFENGAFLDEGLREKAKRNMERVSDTADMIFIADQLKEQGHALKERQPRHKITKGTPIRNEHEKVKRNGPCPCGSGHKFKKCCMGH